LFDKSGQSQNIRTGIVRDNNRLRLSQPRRATFAAKVIETLMVWQAGVAAALGLAASDFAEHLPHPVTFTISQAGQFRPKLRRLLDRSGS
jgi:hypothetical protein